MQQKQNHGMYGSHEQVTAIRCNIRNKTKQQKTINTYSQQWEMIQDIRIVNHIENRLIDCTFFSFRRTCLS